MRIGLARHRNRALSHPRACPRPDVHKPVLAEQARLLAPLGIDSARSALSSRPDAPRSRRATTSPRSFRRGSSRFIRSPARATAACRSPSGRSSRSRCRRAATAGAVDRDVARAATSCARRTRIRAALLRRSRSATARSPSTAAALSLASLVRRPRLRSAARRRRRSACRSSASSRPGSPTRTFPQGAGPSRVISPSVAGGDHRGDDPARDRRRFV